MTIWTVLTLAADVRSGKVGYWEAALRPHNEHLMPLLRVAFHANAALFGIDARPFRLAIFAAHALTAWLLGMFALRYTASRAAALAAAVAYGLPSGLSSMMLWVVTAAGMPIGTAGIAAALLALAHRETLGVRRSGILAGAGCLSALSTGTGRHAAPGRPAVARRARAAAHPRSPIARGLESFLLGCQMIALILAACVGLWPRGSLGKG